MGFFFWFTYNKIKARFQIYEVHTSFPLSLHTIFFRTKPHTNWHLQDTGTFNISVQFFTIPKIFLNLLSLSHWLHYSCCLCTAILVLLFHPSETQEMLHPGDEERNTGKGSKKEEKKKKVNFCIAVHVLFINNFRSHFRSWNNYVHNIMIMYHESLLKFYSFFIILFKDLGWDWPHLTFNL